VRLNNIGISSALSLHRRCKARWPLISCVVHSAAICEGCFTTQNATPVKRFVFLPMSKADPVRLEKVFTVDFGLVPHGAMAGPSCLMPGSFARAMLHRVEGVQRDFFGGMVGIPSRDPTSVATIVSPGCARRIQSRSRNAFAANKMIGLKPGIACPSFASHQSHWLASAPYYCARRAHSPLFYQSVDSGRSAASDRPCRTSREPFWEYCATDAGTAGMIRCFSAKRASPFAFRLWKNELTLIPDGGDSRETARSQQISDISKSRR
jgi:hypothetical protein